MNKKDTPIDHYKMEEFENGLRDIKNSSNDTLMIIIGVAISAPVILILIIVMLLAEGMTY